VGVDGRVNPYVGPRAFVTGERLHGRERELADLTDLLIAERIVLLYAPSGAGKSSLLQAGLVPRMQAEGFLVHPTVRVGLAPPAAAGNRFAASTLLSLGADPAGDLAAYWRARPPAEAELLIFDQFEEVLTADPTGHAARLEFFAGLSALLRDERRWAVFALREDHLAGLDPYRAAVPTRLRVGFRLDLLGPAAALAAVRAPAAACEVDFDADAAARLVDDLRQIKVPTATGAAPRVGPYVEPVQLQVVCRSLWARLPAGARRIDAGDLQALGDVDQALAAYHDATVAAVATTSRVPERSLRAWLARHLVTEHDLRAQVLETPDATLGLPNPALRGLVDAHLLRAEERRGMTWYELAHDRLVAPLRASDARWTAAHLGPVERQAALWDQQGRPESLLLADLAQLDALLAAADERTPVERAFLEQGAAQARREAQARRARRTLRVLVAALAVAVVAGLAVALAYARRNAALQDALATAHRREADHFLGRQLRAHASLLRDRQPELAALLAVAAAPYLSRWESTAALLEPVGRLPLLEFTLPGDAPTAEVALVGEVLAVVDRGGGLRLWDLRARRLLGRSRAGAEVRCVAPLPGARRLAVGDGRRVELWDLDRGAPLRTLVELDGRVDDLQVHPDGALLAARVDRAGADAEAVVVALADGAVRRRVPLAGGRTDLAFHARPPMLIFGVGARVRVAPVDGEAFDLPEISDPGPKPTLVRVALSDDGRDLFALTEGGRLFAYRDGRFEPVLGHTLPVVRDLAPARGEATLATLALDEIGSRNELLLWRSDTLAPRGSPIQLAGTQLDGLALAAGEPPRLVSGGFDGVVRVWDPTRLRPLAPTRPQPTMTVDDPTSLVEPHRLPRLGYEPRRDLTPRPPTVVAASRDGRHVAYGGCRNPPGEDCGGGEVVVWDLERGEAVDTYGAAGPVVALHVDGGGVTSLAGGVLRTRWPMAGVDLARAEVAVPEGAAVALGGAPVRLAWAVPGGVAVRQGGAEATLQVPGAAWVSALALDAAGDRLALAACADAACVRATLAVWDLVARAPAWTAAHAHRGRVRGLRFSPDGARLASGGADGAVIVHDLGGADALTLIPPDEPRPLDDLAFSPDGEVLAAVRAGLTGPRSAAAEILLWDPRSGDERSPTLRAHDLRVPGPETARRSLAFSGARLVSGSFDGAVVWPLDPADLRRRACTLAGRALTAREWARFADDRPLPPVCKDMSE
jgi:WD40 repeat protein